MCFPMLFPYGRGNPTNPRRRHAVTPTEGFKYLQRCCSHDPQARQPFRFASHPRFPHWCQTMLERHQMFGQAPIYLKRSEPDAALTIY